MTRAQERMGRRIARAIRAIEFSVNLLEGRRHCEVDLTEDGYGRVPRVEVRHPSLERDGFLWLVAIVTLEPSPALTYGVPVYRDAIERTLDRVLSLRSVA